MTEEYYDIDDSQLNLTKAIIEVLENLDEE